MPWDSCSSRGFAWVDRTVDSPCPRPEQAPAACQDQRAVRAERAPDMEGVGFAVGQVVPGQEAVHQSPSGHGGPRTDWRPVARRASRKAKKARKSPVSPYRARTACVGSSADERGLRCGYHPDRNLSDTQFDFGKFRGKLVSELADQGRDMWYIKWCLDNLDPFKWTAHVLPSCTAHYEAYVNFLNSQ